LGPSEDMRTFDRICMELFLSAIVDVLDNAEAMHCFEMVTSIKSLNLPVCSQLASYNLRSLFLKTRSSSTGEFVKTNRYRVKLLWKWEIMICELTVIKKRKSFVC